MTTATEKDLTTRQTTRALRPTGCELGYQHTEGKARTRSYALPDRHPRWLPG
jgi:hypothetical protein